MKRVLSILLAVVLLIFIFSSCGVRQVNDSLTVYFRTDVMLERIWAEAVSRYELDTGIEIQMYDPLPEGASEEQIANHNQKLRAEIMAGNGPDVFVYSYDIGKEFYKMMESGAFLDFDELIADDKEFSMGDYEQVVMDAGIYAGKRYTMPLAYKIPMLITTQEKMERFGVSKEDFKTYENFLDTALRIQAEGGGLGAFSTACEEFYRSGGWLSEMVDLSTKTVDTSPGTIDKCMEIFKNEREIHARMNESSYLDFWADSSYGDTLFYPISQRYDLVHLLRLEDVNEDDTLNLLPIPNSAGEITASVTSFCAITSTSSNVDNAWKFVKTMLSKHIQPFLSQDTFSVGVLSELIDSTVKPANGEWSISENLIPQYEAAITQMLWLYQNYDNAAMGQAKYWWGDSTGPMHEVDGGIGSSGSIAYEYLSEYVESDIPVDLTELKEEAARQLYFWMEE